MKIQLSKQKMILRSIALLMALLLVTPTLTSCGGGSSNQARMAPIDDTRGGYVASAPGQNPQAKQGLSNGQKVAILAGAAALYYLYNQHKNAQAQHGPQSKYYLSKNGRVYYRDAQGRAHWVTPPAEGIRVPEAQARQYQDFQGYNGRTTGRDLSDLASREPAPVF